MPLEMNCINAHGAALRILQRVEVEEVEAGGRGGGGTLLDVSFHSYCNYVHYVHSGEFSYCPSVIIMCNNVLKIQRISELEKSHSALKRCSVSVS